MKHGIDKLRSRLFRHVTNGGSERGAALMSTMLFMILLAGLSLVLLSTIVSQMNASYGAVKSTKTVNASQAGLQAALGVLRGIGEESAGKIFGATDKLPCDALSGMVDGENAQLTYTVSIDYYLEDPTGKSEDWLSNPINKLTCAPGTTGPTDGAKLTQPKFAVITSEGLAPSREGVSDEKGNRTISAVYQFWVTNENIPGGRLFTFDGTECLEATSKKKNSHIDFVPIAQCSGDNELQMWVYDDDYQIKLASTITDGPTLCITDQATGSKAQFAKLEECADKKDKDSDRYQQLWSWVGSNTWFGQKNPIADGTSNRCLSTPEKGKSGHLEVNTDCAGEFAPSPAVGAGAAGYDTNQIVNFKEFGRCLDVTNEQIAYDFMIAYPCKQDPSEDGKFLKWNHKWYYDEPEDGKGAAAKQQIRVYDAGGKAHCLQSPGLGAWDNNPRFKSCNSSVAEQYWIRVQEVDEYASSYLFKDYRDRCLTADSSATYKGWSKITVATCTGNTEQKWNAPANDNNSDFGSFKEVHD